MSVVVMNGATGESSGPLTVDADEVMRDTWGHLDVKTGIYPGSIVFAVGMYGDGARAIVSAEFGDAGYGPWFYQCINDWLGDQDLDAGIYRFDGYYRRGRGDRQEFIGAVKALSS